MASVESIYLFRCVNEHIEFRVPELESLASMMDIQLNWVEKPAEAPYLLLSFDKEEDIHRLMSRSMLVRSVYQLWGCGSNEEELHESIKSKPEQMIQPHLSSDKTFRISVESFNKSLTSKEKLQRINALDFLSVGGKVDLKNPTTFLQLMEYYGLDPNDVPIHPHKLFFGRWISDGKRDLIDKFSLRTRLFIGNTSMDPQLSFIMNNMAQVRPGDIVVDPFVGTGSILVSAASQGAYIWGWDIHYLTLHALTKPTRAKQKVRSSEESIRMNLEQYGLGSKYLDVAVMDSAQTFWRRIPFIDAIVTDPPYGIRESLYKVGTAKELPPEEDFSQYGAHFPSKISYKIKDIFIDLLNFAATHLVIGGRLVFWLPGFREDYTDERVPRHPCLELVSNCEQVLNTHSSRRLITLTKVKHPKVEELATVGQGNFTEQFREKFFQASVSLSKEERIARKSLYPRDKRGQGLAYRVKDASKPSSTQTLPSSEIVINDDIADLLPDRFSTKSFNNLQNSKSINDEELRPTVGSREFIDENSISNLTLV